MGRYTSTLWTITSAAVGLVVALMFFVVTVGGISSALTNTPVDAVVVSAPSATVHGRFVAVRIHSHVESMRTDRNFYAGEKITAFTNGNSDASVSDHAVRANVFGWVLIVLVGLVIGGFVGTVIFLATASLPAELAARRARKAREREWETFYARA